MDRQNPFAPPPVGAVDDNPPIEAPRSQQRRIEHVRTVRRRDENDALVRLKSVHFDKELIERLLPFIVPAPEPGPSLPAAGVDLIDEHDAGGMRLALLEQVADAGIPKDEDHGTCASAASARASSVLPVPGGPIRSTPFGMCPPSFWNFAGSLRNAMISCSSSLASSTPATSLKVTFFCELDDSLALLWPIERSALTPRGICRTKKITTPMSSRIGTHEYSHEVKELCVGS